MSDDHDEIEGSRAPLLEHLVELRKRLIISVAAFGVGFIICFAFAQPIYLFLLHPFEMASRMIAAQKQGAHHGPLELLEVVIGLKAPPASTENLRLVFTAPLEFFFTKMKLAGFGAVVLAFPILASQLYRFVAPGLYKREKKAFLPFLLASPVLFLMGAALVYYVMLPFVLWFSLSQQIVTANISVELLPKVSDYLDLVTKLLLAFGLCFQLPVVLSLAGLAGLISSSTLAKGRRYAIVGIVVVAAFVTPPDPFTQILLSVPIYGLYEISIWCVRLMERRRKTEETKEVATVP
ncbi:MAG TPA: twin-arginine translocase subunit TatC [Caulobacteraceae bacterium]|nr:twin-arginine translocase subunit TatC [Caulobacteraceae bacterium]